jgi:hypothetical protein
MKKLTVAFLFTLALCVAASAQQCKEYSVPNSAFAFCAPAGWVLKSDPKNKSLSFETPEVPNKLGAALVVDHDTVPVIRDLLAYQLIQAELKAEGYSNTRLVVARDFDSASGVKGTMLVFFLEMKELPFVQGFYIFEGPNNAKLTLTVTGPQDDKELAKVMEVSMKSVRLKK